ncbi:ABC transporter ATP-binding protein [Frankia sp. CNm7]|uniref:ABC transporter ATP-binding protein n=1 Tax=Frankia nepalensis TaxID=1836974 RepID=A0A937RQG0_9ACTN|nr:ABC transporter ATP-binding protein [Frankia nepalensis]MBL7495632.1 ABC transporter ATP-binding protein [Frankia nepalensis]MBL7508878.1 ABC transporter ATP-binding protein [Frankia nepalensis]MBL7520326.1 ABC transporter ATP-binding protein [Frankia nepalensis]MBL7630101.1 ABC transporter ATP-binding protein [Frankia nepalensis]
MTAPVTVTGPTTRSAVRAVGLGKRYGSRWALRDCTFDLPAGSVTALVGQNGAGKSTLLHLAVGLTEPTAGRVEILGSSARRQPRDVLPRLGFVAQDHALEPRFRVADMLEVGRRLNPRWDAALAREHLARLGIPLGQRVGGLSGGQRAQVALTMALAKRPEILVLDEPAAALDPLARRELLRMLMGAAADTGLTVLLSSHVISDLERVCDHLVILAAGEVRLTGPTDEVVAAHRLLSGPRTEPTAVARMHHVVSENHTDRQTTLLVRSTRHVYDSRWRVDEIGLEEIVLGYLSQTAPGKDVTE